MKLLTSDATKIVKNRANDTLAVRWTTDKPSRVEPEHKDSADIDKILKRYGYNAVLSHSQKQSVSSDDVQISPAKDEFIEQSLNASVNVAEVWERMPVKVKSQFKDKLDFLMYMSNNDNFSDFVAQTSQAEPTEPSGEDGSAPSGGNRGEEKPPSE